MKLTLNIEVDNCEELSGIAEALKGFVSAEQTTSSVTHETDSKNYLEEAAAPKAAPAKKGGKAKKVDPIFPAPSADDMIPEPSPYSQPGPVPSAPLVSHEPQVMPPAVPQSAPVQAAPTFQGLPNAVEIIKAEAGKLEKSNLDTESKRAVIRRLLDKLSAPQGVPASQLPEPFLSQFASQIGQEVHNAINGAVSNGLV